MTHISSPTSVSDFTSQYSLSKTIRFELKPIGRTQEHIETKGLIEEDEKRAESYKEVKAIIDDYHRDFIDEVLAEATLPFDLVEELLTKTDTKELADREKRKAVQKKLRTYISELFTKNKKFKFLDKKELFTTYLPKFIGDDEAKQNLISEFKGFSTYFSGFHENRHNMYVAEDKATAISYRLIHQNLPKFGDNIGIFRGILTSYPDLAVELNNIPADLGVNTDIGSIFETKYFNKTLSQEGINLYNKFIGGYTIKDGEHVQGVNQRINQYRQKNGIKKSKLSDLKPLFKQILSDRESDSFKIDTFENDQQVLGGISNYFKKHIFNLLEGESEIDVLQKLEELFSTISSYNLEQIFAQNDTSLTGLSQEIFGDWSYIGSALDSYYDSYIGISKVRGNSYEEAKRKWLKADIFSLSLLEEALGSYQIAIIKENPSYKIKSILGYLKQIKIVSSEEEGPKTIFSEIRLNYETLKNFLQKDYPTNKKLSQDRPRVQEMKSLLDCLLTLLRIIKVFQPKEISEAKDEAFYSDYEIYMTNLSQIVPVYNKIRNYLTQKPYSVEKIKLNFGVGGNFLNGWVESSTDNSDNGTQYGGYLFRKKNDLEEYEYFLGISADKKLFRSKNRDLVIDEDLSRYERFTYYQVKSQTILGSSYQGRVSYADMKKELIKSFYDLDRESQAWKESLEKFFEKDTSTPKGFLLKLEKDQPSHYKRLLSSEGFKKLNEELILGIKDTLRSLVDVPAALDLASKNHALFSEYIEGIENISSTAKIYSYFHVSEKEMEKAKGRSDKPLFFFRISNKDLSYGVSKLAGLRKSRGRDNLHTLYFKKLMEGNQTTYDIGTGEVFFRRETAGLVDSTVRHVANEAILNKSRKDCSSSTFPYEIVKDKRFTTSKFFFHLSMDFNYEKKKNKVDISNKVRELCKNYKQTNIIGIDRGERNLLYLTLIDKSRNIINQFSLNEIANSYQDSSGREVAFPTNYQEKLELSAGVRDQKRKSWDSIGKIKELKEGYLSHVVHRVASLMVEYNAILVMEDLNMGFKRGRQKVEKQVYQKFEKMLIDKLNYFVMKQNKDDEPGGLFNAYQLTDKYNIKDLNFKKQSGFIFYVPPSLTSKIDPSTGFVSLLYPKYENIDKAVTYFRQFDSIRYNSEEDYFEFHVDYSRFSGAGKKSESRWIICTTNHVRYDWQKNVGNAGGQSGEQISVDVSNSLKQLFNDYGIEYQAVGCLLSKVLEIGQKQFYWELIRLLRITVALRYNNGKKGSEEQDFILSPVRNSKGEFFNTLLASDSEPKDADANGAYNIALKGLYLVNKIKNSENLGKIDFKIPDTDWLAFAQEG